MTQARLLGGRYQVGELLGYGGMAEVHRGRDLRLGRDVAIKMLRTDLARDDTFQLRFRREAQNAASLNHPAIVAVYDTGEERAATGEPLPYIVMEFVNGRTLKEVLAVEGRLTPRRALDFTAEIAAALEFSHRHGIIHRDIKPGNVMLTQTGQVKVMDFGIARALASGTSTMTQTSAVIGTAQYLSPEQARGEAVDARSDVYATGCVLFELLCGHPPFVGDSPVSVAYQHVREDPKPPSQSNRDVSPAVDAIVLKALAKNPLNRYQSAAEMRADVLRAAAGRPVFAEPVMREADGTAAMPTARLAPPGPRALPSARVSGPARRRTSGWAIAGLTALAVLAIVALVAGLIVSQQPTKQIVPALVGKTNAEAEALLKDRKLAPDPRAVNRTDCAPNAVLSQATAANTRVDEGTKITYEWCSGPGSVTVPAVLNVTLANAEQQLKAAELKSKVERVDSDKPADTVIDVNPPAGTTIAKGSEVALKVSKGNLKAVPDVSGKGYTTDTAKAVLRQAGFLDVKVVPEDTKNPAENGKVLRQSPAAGSVKDPAATTITIQVGDYNPPVTTPPTPGPTSS
jgi:beta-lactam-binding protein with PASTA domain/predicted Ser/Thr protein kinase